MNPELILCVYAIILGVIVRLLMYKIFQSVTSLLEGSKLRVGILARTMVRMGILFMIVTIAIWALVNQYLLNGTTNTLMIGTSVLGGLGITVIVPSVGLIFVERHL